MAEQRAVPSPSRVFQVAFFGALFGIGWVFGRTWYMIVHAVWGVGYFLRVVKYGYLKGAKIKPKPTQSKPLETPETVDRAIGSFKESFADASQMTGSYMGGPLVADFPVADARATVG